MRVGSSYLQGVCRNVRAGDAPGRTLPREGDCYAARAGAKIEGGAQHAARARALERDLDQTLAVGTWNEHARIDAQQDAVKLALTEQVRNRLACATSLEQLAKCCKL